MKKVLCIAAFLSLCLGSFAQTSVYHPFPDANAHWNENVQHCCFGDCGGGTTNPIVFDDHFSYFLQGDTLINTFTYHKIYQTGTRHQHCVFGNLVNDWSNINQFAGAYRQDTILKKVYFYNPNISQECLLYDFSLHIGDTVKTPCLYPSACVMIVQSIDSVLVGVHYHKRFNISSVPYQWIEGIGSTGGLLEDLCPFEVTGELLCFSRNGIPLFPYNATSCAVIPDSITNIANEITTLSNCTLSPNPFTTSTLITLNQTYQNITLGIYNLQGQKVAEHQYADCSEINLQRGGLAEGMYFLKLTLDGKMVETAKIIISE